MKRLLVLVTATAMLAACGEKKPAESAADTTASSGEAEAAPAEEMSEEAAPAEEMSEEAAPAEETEEEAPETGDDSGSMDEGDAPE